MERILGMLEFVPLPAWFALNALIIGLVLLVIRKLSSRGLPPQKGVGCEQSVEHSQCG